MSLIIAIDGPAAAGKGTVARALAEKFDFAYLDTGALYRGVALAAVRADLTPDSDDFADQAAKLAQNLDMDLLTDPALRHESTALMASKVASIPAVRAALLAFQRDFATSPPEKKQGAILDGRDIGTVVCPEAPVKLFVTASPEERAKRRFLEMQAKDDSANYDQILADVKLRDDRDMNRKDAPLKPHADAHLIDTTNLSIEAAVDRASGVVNTVMMP